MSRFSRVLVALVTLVLTLGAVRLAVWQFDRHTTRREANGILLAAREQPALDLAEQAPAAGRRAVARGAFETRGQLVLRSRVHRQAPGVHVVTPFRLEGDRGTIWVLRGFVGAADGIRPDSIPMPTPGAVAIAGEFQELPVADRAGEPVVVGGDTTWRRFDRAVARSRRPEAPPLILYLEGGPSGPGRLAAVEPPSLDGGPHLSYAIQWLAIALAIAAFGLWVLRRPAGRGPLPPDGAP